MLYPKFLKALEKEATQAGSSLVIDMTLAAHEIYENGHFNNVEALEEKIAYFGEAIRNILRQEKSDDLAADISDLNIFGGMIMKEIIFFILNHEDLSAAFKKE